MKPKGAAERDPRAGRHAESGGVLPREPISRVSENSNFMNPISVNCPPEDEAGGAARVVILGAGRSLKGNLPAALVQTDPGHRVLDWQLASFEGLPGVEVDFVGGFKADSIARQYPGIRLFFNSEWETTGPLASLARAPWERSQETFVSYADVVFRADAVAALRAEGADVALAVDTLWRERYESRSEADVRVAEKIAIEGGRVAAIGKEIDAKRASAEYAGLMRLSARAAGAVGNALRGGRFDDRAGLPELVGHLIASGFEVRPVDVRGDWAELNAPQDLGRFVLGTKAESLERLRPLLRSGKIGEQVRFTEGEWSRNRGDVIGAIQRTFGEAAVIVRSSALSEDGWAESAAGAHRSVLDVDCRDAGAIERAVEEVVASYRRSGADNQVLVQAMLRDLSMSGVIMTRSPSHGGPYYVINFDDTGTRTDSVTAGDAAGLRTVFVRRGAAPRAELPEELGRLLETVREIEGLVGHDSLDIEFAVGLDGAVHVLQVRPIAVAQRLQPVDDERIGEALAAAREKFEGLSGPRPFLAGRRQAFSVMADWNPAEMIGVKPRPLAFSLYRYLITDEAWAVQRAGYGYRDVRPANLIVDFAGHPYVDLRVDFNSFVPAALSEDLAGRLVDFWLDRLDARPELHDKVEFQVLLTCLTFDFERRAGALRDAGFSGPEIEELREALRGITAGGIARIGDDLAASEAFAARFEGIRESGLPPLERAHLLLEDVRRLGVPSFAHLARHAFVAVDLLNSLAIIGAVARDEVDAFVASVETVPTRMAKDSARVARGEMDWEAFVSTYGHLRPGSYDITSRSYAEAAEEYLRPMVEAAGMKRAEEAKGFAWSAGASSAIGAELKRAGLGVDAEGFSRFARKAIEGREAGKFAFMRHVDAALSALMEFGRERGLTREDLSYLRIQELLALRDAAVAEAGALARLLSARGRQASYDAQAICLPGYIQSREDFEGFEQFKAVANFVTTKRLQAEVTVLDGEAAEGAVLEGRILVIANADPGYDWIFGRGVGGLITMYGGVNSHMAIRAAELDLPAAIGVGEMMFERLVSASLIDLNCGDRQIRVIR